MAEYFNVSLCIGGRLKKSTANQLMKLFDEFEFVASATGDAIKLVRQLYNPGAVSTGLLTVYSNELHRGECSKLLSFLENEGLAYDMHTDAKYEYDGRIVRYRPGFPTQSHVADRNGHPVCLHADIREALRFADTFDVGKLVTALQELLGPELPVIPKFEVI